MGEECIGIPVSSFKLLTVEGWEEGRRQWERVGWKSDH